MTDTSKHHPFCSGTHESYACPMQTPTTPTTPKCEHECHEVNEQDEHCSWCLPAPQHTSPEKEKTSHAIGFREGHVLGKKQERSRILALLESKKQEKHINQISPDGMLARKINQLLTSLREEITNNS